MPQKYPIEIIFGMTSGAVKPCGAENVKWVGVNCLESDLRLSCFRSGTYHYCPQSPGQVAILDFSSDPKPRILIQPQGDSLPAKFEPRRGQVEKISLGEKLTIEVPERGFLILRGIFPKETPPTIN